MQIIEKDIFKIKEGIIVHQVNCKYSMGAGIASVIKCKYPSVYKCYMNKKSWKLGDTQFIKVRETPEIYICNLAGQYNYGKQGNFTNYDALKMGLNDVNNFSKEKNLQIYIPYKMSCNRAGGDWEIVMQIMEEKIPNAIICKWKSTHRGIL